LFRKRFSIAGALALATSAVCAWSQPSPGKGALRIDDSQVVTLEGNVSPLARPQFDDGVVDSETRLDRMLLELKPGNAQQAELDELVAAQQNPASPLYHQWLNPAEFGARFGASQQDLALVISWLAAHGFEVDEISTGRRLVVFSGSAGQVSDSFHTELHRYQINGETHIANTQDPQIPAALAGVVRGVVSLHDFRRKAETRLQRTVSPQPEYTAGSTHYLYPADFATIYDLNPLYSDAMAGAGSTIAIAGRSNIELSDVTAFRANAGLPANVPQVIVDGNDPGLVAGDQPESTLDVEWSGAVAPAAAVKLVVAGSTATTDGVDLAAAYIVNHAIAPALSLSYGSCEQEMGAAELAFYNDLWEQAASEGISVFVASGDAGAAGCSSGSDNAGTAAAVNGLCSSPYSTCVGGTEFDEGSNPAQYWSAANAANYGSALGYIPEVVWNESAANGGMGMWATGGGTSTVYAQPAWQAETAGAGAANGMRAVPDVALASAGHDGYFLIENGMQWVASGTSVTAPAFAGLIALVIEKQHGAWQGNANAMLYTLASGDQTPFHTTQSGNNTVPGVNGFTASGNLYNLATGLGSVDGTHLVNAWSAEQKTVHVAAGPGWCSRFGLLPDSCAPLQRTPELPRIPLESR
jgi:pseudomonalisin